MCGRPSPSKASATTPSEAASPAPIGTRQGWSSGGLKDRQQEQHIQKPPEPQLSLPCQCQLFLGPPRTFPHFPDVETEARRRAGIPQKVAQPVPSLRPSPRATPSPCLGGTTWGGQWRPTAQGCKSHADSCRLCVPARTVQPLCACLLVHEMVMVAPSLQGPWETGDPHELAHTPSPAAHPQAIPGKLLL